MTGDIILDCFLLREKGLSYNEIRERMSYLNEYFFQSAWWHSGQLSKVADNETAPLDEDFLSQFPAGVKKYMKVCAIHDLDSLKDNMEDGTVKEIFPMRSYGFIKKWFEQEMT